MNEYLFFIHAVVSLLFLFIALYLGKEALIAYLSASWLFANFFVTKQILFFGYEVTASDVYGIGAMLGLSVLQQYWGKKTAKLSLWISFFLLSFATIASFFHLLYTPSPHDTMHLHFKELLQPAPRLFIASIITFLISQHVDITLFSFMQRFEKIPFPLRTGCNLVIVLMIDTLLFSFLGLYGIAFSFIDVCIVSYIIKLTIASLLVPFLSFVKYIFPENLILNKTT